MTDRYELAPGPDVDLDREDVRDSRGRRITAEYAERAAEDALRKVGRPTLAGGSGASPRVTFRVSEEVRDELERRAAADGVSVSTLARRAMEEYLAS